MLNAESGGGMGLGHGDDARHLRDLVAEAAFDAHVEGEVGTRAAVTRAVKADLDLARLGDIHQFDVPPVALNRRPDEVYHALDLVAEIGGGGGIHQWSRRIISSGSGDVA